MADTEQPNQITRELTEAIVQAINVAGQMQTLHGDWPLHGYSARPFGLPGLLALTLPDGTGKQLTLRLDDMPMYGLAVVAIPTEAPTEELPGDLPGAPARRWLDTAPLDRALEHTPPSVGETVAVQEYDSADPEPRDWEVVWVQSILFQAGYDATWEVLEGNLTEGEAVAKLPEWRQSLKGAYGVLIKARRRVPDVTEDPKE